MSLTLEPLTCNDIDLGRGAPFQFGGSRRTPVKATTSTRDPSLVDRGTRFTLHMCLIHCAFTARNQDDRLQSSTASPSSTAARTSMNSALASLNFRFWYSLKSRTHKKQLSIHQEHFVCNQAGALLRRFLMSVVAVGF